MTVGRPVRTKGFTLIELMVTVAVLSVLLVAASPSFADFFERYRLRSAADDVLNLFAAARQGAVEADRNVAVKFAADTTDWCVGGIQQVDPAVGDPVPLAPAACACDTAPGTCLVGGQQLVASSEGRGVTIGAGNTSFTFDSKNGTLSPLASQSVDFLSSSARYGLRVQVSPLGQARACVVPGKRPVPGYQEC